MSDLSLSIRSDAHGARIVSLPTSPLLNDAAGGILPEIDLSADADDHSLLALPAELIVVVLEQLPFDVLLAARATCTRLRAMALYVTRAVLQRKEQLSLPLLQPFGKSLLWLELEGAAADWLPRLCCCLGVLPRLTRLFIRRAKSTNHLTHSLAETATLAIAGALQAGACRQLHHLNIDERLPEDKVGQIARAMHPNGGLLFGASHGYESVIDEMLRKGASSEVALEDGANALIVASYHGGAPVKRLLDHGANVCARRHDGVSALIMAANRGHTTTVEELLEARADVNMAMRDGTTALHTATYKGHTSVVAALIAAGAMVQARCHDGVAALLMAAKSGRDELVRMLLAAKAEVDAALRDGGTPLLAAAYKGHDSCVEALITHKANVDASRADGLTPLCQASKAGHVRCVELLLQAKANVEAAGAVYGTTSLLMASKGGHATIVNMLLDYGADTEVAGRAYGTTSLVAAGQHGNSEVVALLLRGKADPFKKLLDGSTALKKAEEAGHKEVCALLRQAMGQEAYDGATRVEIPHDQGDAGAVDQLSSRLSGTQLSDNGSSSSSPSTQHAPGRRISEPPPPGAPSLRASRNNAQAAASAAGLFGQAAAASSTAATAATAATVEEPSLDVALADPTTCADDVRDIVEKAYLEGRLKELLEEMAMALEVAMAEARAAREEYQNRSEDAEDLAEDGSATHLLGPDEKRRMMSAAAEAAEAADAAYAFLETAELMAEEVQARNEAAAEAAREVVGGGPELEAMLDVLARAAGE